MGQQKGFKIQQQMPSPAHGKKIPCHGWGTGLLKRNWRSWQTGSWTWAITVPWQERPAASGDPASRSKETINPHSSALRWHLDAVARLWVPQHKTDKLESVQWRTTKMLGGLEHLPCEEKLRDRCFWAWRRGGFGDTYQLFKPTSGPWEN